MPPVTLDDFNAYLSPYVGDQAKLALLLDYDGNSFLNIADYFSYQNLNNYISLGSVIIYFGFNDN